MYYLYVIQHSLTGRLYIGITDNVEKRLKEHNKPSNAGYTRTKSGNWLLVGSRKFSNKTEAFKEEQRLKRSKNKKYILWYIRAASSIGRATPS